MQVGLSGLGTRGVGRWGAGDGDEWVGHGWRSGGMQWAGEHGGRAASTMMTAQLKAGRSGVKSVRKV